MKFKKKKITEKSKHKYFFLNYKIFQDFTEDKFFEEWVDNYNKISLYITVKNSRLLLSIQNLMFYDIIFSQANQVYDEISKINQKVQNIESV